MSMHSQGTGAVNLSAEDRLHFFVRSALSNKELWGLYDDGWAEMNDENGKKGMMVWPDQATAQLIADERFPGYEPKQIKLSSFTQRWLDKLAQQRFKVAVFATPLDGPKFVTPEELKAQLS